MDLKHQISHKEVVEGILYRTAQEKDFEEVLDFYFEVFLKGENLPTVFTK